MWGGGVCSPCQRPLETQLPGTCAHAQVLISRTIHQVYKQVRLIRPTVPHTWVRLPPGRGHGALWALGSFPLPRQRVLMTHPRQLHPGLISWGRLPGISLGSLPGSCVVAGVVIAGGWPQQLLGVAAWERELRSAALCCCDFWGAWAVPAPWG